MGDPFQAIDRSYEQFYATHTARKVYPTEFVVRTFLAQYPGLDFPKPKYGARVLDVAFGDGRNTAFLCDQGFEVSGVEITEGIVRQTDARLESLGHRANLRVGRNTSLPFDAGAFDYLLACHCCYYCDEGETFADNMREYARVIAPAGWLVASLASRNSYIFNQAEALNDGSLRIKVDPYGNREGYRLQAFSCKEEIESYLSPWFERFSFGFADNNFYGVSERLFWVVCRRKNA